MSDNSSQGRNGSGGRLFTGSDPVRLSVTTALAQIFVWPFVYIDIFMFVVFLKRRMLKAEARYVLFAQTLIADTAFLLTTNFVVITYQVFLLLPVGACLPLTLLMGGLTHVSPTTIIAMCIERYVAICMPLRHVNIFSPARTMLMVALVWLISFSKPFIDFTIFLSYVAKSYFSQPAFCYYEIILLEDWHMIMRGNLFILNYLLVLLILAFCYGSIMHVARKASGDNKQAASKGQRTLLLHILQLVLCTLEVTGPLIEARVLEIGDVNIYLIVRYFNFLAFSVVSRAISPLVYGLRDEKFNAAMRYYAKCGFNHISAEK
ncbi:odorant receptor 131-2-like [Alosa alosa]|uniref:odorant receptor 131-2-like n=1 Tax=Alosa sapidissima TaxID=34773 RepID=UPI001C08514D|nr:odorant receptor 131-2-like [Alosa sapidissima]XP_048119971.1 odorant receptor 131-2-like [Alosa alosa]